MRKFILNSQFLNRLKMFHSAVAKSIILSKLNYFGNGASSGPQGHPQFPRPLIGLSTQCSTASTSVAIYAHLYIYSSASLVSRMYFIWMFWCVCLVIRVRGYILIRIASDDDAHTVGCFFFPLKFGNSIDGLYDYNVDKGWY